MLLVHALKKKFDRYRVMFWQALLLLLSLSFTSASSASSLDLPVHGLIELAEGPPGTDTLEALTVNANHLSWRPVRFHDGILFQSRHVYFLRFKVPDYSPTESVVLEWNYMHPEAADQIGSRAFIEVDGKLQEIPSLTSRFSSYMIARANYGRTLYLSNKQGSFPIALLLTITLKEQDAFHKTQENNQFFIGAFLGIVGIIAFINLWLFSVFRKAYSAWHCAYCVSAMFINAALNGILRFSDLNMILTFGSGGLWMISLVIFSIKFFRVKDRMPIVYKLGLVLVSLAVIVPLALMLGVESIVSNFTLLAPIYLIYCFLLALHSAYQGYKPAYYIMFGWSCLIVSFIILAIQVTWNLSIEVGWASPIAVVVEIVSFTLAVQMQIKQDEVRYQKKIRHAFNEMSKIVYKHQLTSIEAGHSLETTMPTKDAQAYVLSFDIIGSSKIDNHTAKELIRRVFLRCHGLMAEGYDGIELKARAYRIKEVGDGFLCSVGYPFRSLSDCAAEDAIELAYACVEVLIDEGARFLPGYPIACGIGIAYGHVSGFYPPSGTKEYDLFGRAIVHATRYEAMRKSLFIGHEGRSVIIIQEKVFTHLTDGSKAQFQSLNLEAQQAMVRDDGEAKVLYFQFL